MNLVQTVTRSREKSLREFFYECLKIEYHVINRPFPSSLVPLFQNESSCKNLSYVNEFDLHENEPSGETISHESFHTKTRFDTEAKDNSEMVW